MLVPVKDLKTPNDSEARHYWTAENKPETHRAPQPEAFTAPWRKSWWGRFGDPCRAQERARRRFRIHVRALEYSGTPRGMLRDDRELLDCSSISPTSTTIVSRRLRHHLEGG